MRKIFFIYWIWHIVLILIQEYSVLTPVQAKWTGVFIVLNLSFLVIAPKLRDMLIAKHTHSDYCYDIAITATIISRLLTMAVAVLGLREIQWILFCDTLTVFIFIFAKRRLERFSTSKFIDVINKKHADID